jgi:hypothetical protein
MKFSGWFLVNILAPVLLPVLGTLPFLLLAHRLPVPGAKALLMSTVKDGQLCWAVIAMSVSTIYELWQAQGMVPQGGAALAGSIIVMLPASVVAAGGAVFSTPLLAAPAGTAKAWASHYRMFVGSAIMVALVAFDYAYVHVSRSQRPNVCMPSTHTEGLS